jgi:hypothetical protein
MDPDVERRNTAVLSSLALLLSAVAALFIGRFVQLDDTSGFGSDRWIVPLGVLAVLLTTGSLGVGIRDRAARRALGAALAVLDAFVIVLAAADDGFRFIWGRDEGELSVLQLALGLAALFLLTPRFLSPRATDEARPARELTGWARFAVYSTALVVAGFAAFHAGAAHFEATECSGPGFDGECDVAALEGLAWAGAVFILVVVAATAVEVTRARRRRRLA